MATILTADEFKKKYGDKGVGLFNKSIPQSPQQKRPNFLQRVKQKITQRGEELGEDVFQATQKGTIGKDPRIALRTAGAVGGSIGDIFIEGIKSVLKEKGTELAKTGLEKTVGKAISSVAQTDVGQATIQWAKKHPEAVKDLENVFDIAAALPLVRGATTAGEFGLRSVKTGLKTSAKAIGEGLSLSGAGTEKLGKKIVSMMYSPTEEQAGKIISHQAKTTMWQRLKQSADNLEMSPQTLADTVIKYDLAGLTRGNIGARAKRIMTRLWNNQVNPTLEGIKDKITKKEIFDATKKDILKIKDISRRKSLLNAYDALAEDYKHVTSWGAKTANKIKSDMAGRLPSKVWKGQDIAGDMNNVRKIFSSKLRKAVRERLPQNVKDIYDDYGSLKTIADRGSKSLTRGFDQGIIGLTSEAIRIMATPITTIGGTGVSKVGGVIKGLGQKLK